MQIEALSKELYYDLGGVKPRGDNTIFFDEDCLKEIDIKWSTHKKVVLVTSPFFNLTKDENRILKPLKEAHKRQGTYWERAYQAVKHDRYNSLAMGNVKALIHSMSALYLLNLYYRQDEWNIGYEGEGFACVAHSEGLDVPGVIYSYSSHVKMLKANLPYLLDCFWSNIK